MICKPNFDEMQSRPGRGWNFTLFEDGQPAGGGIFPLPQEEFSVGMTWWNSMMKDARTNWLVMTASAAPSCCPSRIPLGESV